MTNISPSNPRRRPSVLAALDAAAAYATSARRPSAAIGVDPKVAARARMVHAILATAITGAQVSK